MSPPRETIAERFEQAGMTLFERGWLSSNNMLFVDGADSVLVDSGYCAHAAQTVALVRHRLADAPLRRVVNTHLHSDHCGGNHALQLAFGCSVDVPIGEAAKVDAWDEDRLSYRDTGQECPRFVRHGVIRNGETLRLGPRDWQVIAAPGHDPESVVLYQADMGLLLSADALWENGFGVVFPEIEGGSAFDAVASTLDAIARLRVDVVVPGHGAPFGDIAEAIARARARLDSFVRSPDRHARHAAKVLIKFHLLEHQRRSTDLLVEWLIGTRFMRLVHERYFGSTSLTAWSQTLLGELCASGALRVEDGMVLNV
jgi:glyoxylase-like metal-dependent hydrolase (beta-lactamase superfamily II)